MQTLDPSAATRSRFFIRKPPSSPHLFAVLIGGKASERRKTVMSSARNFYVIGVTGDPETVGIMEQPRERIDIRCRSEEHTSELQSLMRISYAVFCLKKKTLDATINIF